MRSLCVDAVLLSSVVAFGGPAMPVEFTFASAGCSSYLLTDVPEDGPGCPLPQVVRWDFADDVLRIEFSVGANCCPSENRFAVDSWGSADSLVIAVADTAPDECRCMCPYLITVEYLNLSADTYTVRAVPWGDYELFSPTLVERGGAGESEPIESIYKQFQKRSARREAP